MEINSILDTKEARKNFLIGMVFIAKADGVVDDSELEFFHNAAVAMGIDADIIDLYWKIDLCPQLCFSGVIQKRFFIREAVQLCCINGEYTDEEKKLVRSFATQLGISDSVVETFEDWVCRGMIWKREGDELLRGDA